MPYRIVFKGTPGQILNIGNLPIAHNEVKYVDALPVALAVLKKVAGVSVESVTDKPATAAAAEAERAALTGAVGIKWVGTVSVRTTEYGKFTKDEARWDLPLSAVEDLAKRSGFVRVG